MTSVAGRLRDWYTLPERTLDALFFRTGRLVAGFPWTCILVTLALFAATAAGCYNVQFEESEDVWDIYFPMGFPSTEGNRKLSDDFPSQTSENYWTFQEGGDLMIINALFLAPDASQFNASQLSGDIRAVCEATAGFKADVLGRRGVALQDVCARRLIFGQHVCVTPSICDYIATGDGHHLCMHDSYLSDSMLPASGLRLNASSVCPGEEIMFTPAIRLSWFFRKDTTPQRRLSEAWIKKAFDRLYSLKSRLPTTVHLFSLTVQFEEYHSIVQNDGPYVVLTIIMMTVFSIAVSVRLPLLTSCRSTVAIAGVLTTCLAIGSTVGIMSYLSIPYIECALLTPFIMIGIGIDSTFVLLFTWAQQDMSLGAQECLGRTLRKAMMSIFISSITSFLAFLVGSFTPYKAVNITCYFLATFIILLLIYETTFFTACLSLHHSRVHRIYVQVDPMNSLERLVRKYLPVIVLHTVTRIVILLGVIVVISVSIHKVLGMQEYLNEIEYQPDGSRILDFYHANKQLYRDPIIVHFVVDEPLDYSDPEIMQELRDLHSNLTATKYAHHDFNQNVIPWFEQFSDLTSADLDPEQFMSQLETRLALFHEFPVVNELVVQHGQVSKSRFLIGLQKVPEKDIDLTREILGEISAIVDTYPRNMYFTSRDLMFWERNATMKKTIWASISIAICCCLVVTLLFLPHPVVFLSVSFCAAATMVSTLGFMATYGIEYSLITYIMVLIMIGLCIDYISHVGHAYLSETGSTSIEIAEKALQNIGVPLFNAALSSILSVAILAFSTSVLMRRMFQSLVTLFSLSFFYGVIFLPILLSFVGPVPGGMTVSQYFTRKLSKKQKLTVQNEKLEVIEPMDDTNNTIEYETRGNRLVEVTANQTPVNQVPITDELNDSALEYDRLRDSMAEENSL